MLFVQSLRGLSHTKIEDTKQEHLSCRAGARPAGGEGAAAVAGLANLKAQGAGPRS